MIIKSRARRPLVIQLPAGLHTPAQPLHRMRVRRTRRVMNAAGEPVDQRVGVDVRLPSAITLAPGERVEVPDELRDLDQFKNLVRGRELVILPAPAPREQPKPTRRSRRRTRK